MNDHGHARTHERVWIEGRTFSMGSDRHYPDEGPVRSVAVQGFWIDPTLVTNRAYSQFVAETGYRTVAERPLRAEDYPGAPPENLQPGSLVFQPTAGPVDLRSIANWWVWTPGADWSHPTGPESDLSGLEDHPVVHIAHEDALAYCDWVGARLPTEAEWELAARGGLEGAEFTWGDENPQEDGEPKANTWQGKFPYENTKRDGWLRTSPVASYEPNGYGLFDMAGNVWEWTSDWFVGRAEPSAPCCGGPSAEERSYDPAMPQIKIPRKVVKGGSHLCTVQYCFRYRPAARQPQMIDSSMSHIGFRCVS